MSGLSSVLAHESISPALTMSRGPTKRGTNTHPIGSKRGVLTSSRDPMTF
jgi:hypothetical protein